jgi:hypothetical protein
MFKFYAYEKYTHEELVKRLQIFLGNLWWLPDRKADICNYRAVPWDYHETFKFTCITKFIWLIDLVFIY